MLKPRASAHILKLPKIGGFHVRLHRPLPDGFTLKTVQVIKKADGWYVNLCLEDPTVPEFKLSEIEPTWDNTLGMDAVLYGDDYLALSDGQKLPSAKFYRNAEKSLNKAKSQKDKAKKGSRRRKKLAKKISKTSQRIARARKDHAFKTAHEVVRTNKKFFVREDLKLKNLTKKNKAKLSGGKYLPNGQSAKSGLNKSWLDAAFGQFFNILEYIAGKAGARVIAVNPEYTSQILSYKDEFVFTETSIREFFDVELGLKVDRDINAAINLLRVGLGVFPTIKRRRGKVVITVTATASTSKEVLDVLRRIATASQNGVDGH
jgi:putative transposase